MLYYILFAFGALLIVAVCVIVFGTRKKTSRDVIITKHAQSIEIEECENEPNVNFNETNDNLQTRLARIVMLMVKSL